MANIPQPQTSDLLAITPGSAQDFKKISLINNALNSTQTLNILIDIYNRIGSLPKTGTLQTQSDLITLLKTLF